MAQTRRTKAKWRSVRFSAQTFRQETVSQTVNFDPNQSAPGKLAKDRRCKSSTG